MGMRYAIECLKYNTSGIPISGEFERRSNSIDETPGSSAGNTPKTPKTNSSRVCYLFVPMQPGSAQEPGRMHAAYDYGYYSLF
jgi:hypothetical protein